MFLYSIKSGFKNLGNNKLFTMASIATIACCVFIFCIFYILVANIDSTIHTVEETIGIQVFFDENLKESEIKEIGEKYFITDDVKSIKFISSDEAWDNVKQEYFGGKKELAEAFEDDNPLASSSSFEILLYDIEKQKQYVDYVSGIRGVRQVNYSSYVIDALTELSVFIGWFSLILIVILVIIAIVLISNTITIASQHRKEENEIMKLIGATNFMVRSPFVFEGVFIGLIGALVPLVGIAFIYKFGMGFLVKKAILFTNVFVPMSFIDIIPKMSLFALAFSIFMSAFVSMITIQKHLSV